MPIGAVMSLFNSGSPPGLGSLMGGQNRLRFGKSREGHFQNLSKTEAEIQ
jgi:hypothetical protein